MPDHHHVKPCLDDLVQPQEEQTVELFSEQDRSAAVLEIAHPLFLGPLEDRGFNDRLQAGYGIKNESIEFMLLGDEPFDKSFKFSLSFYLNPFQINLEGSLFGIDKKRVHAELGQARDKRGLAETFNSVEQQL